MVTDCPWCEGDHDYSESVCFVINEKEIRSRHRPRVKSIAELYDENGSLRSEFHLTDIEDKLREYWRRAARRAWGMSKQARLPVGYLYAIRSKPLWVQLSHRSPWAVVVLKDGKRFGKNVVNLPDAIVLWQALRQKYGNAHIVSRARGYDIPPEFRGELPPGWVWCPRCMKPRQYERAVPEQTFYANKKYWNTEKDRWDYKERTVYLLRCPVCLGNNRNGVYRRSNQPWHTRKIKKGVRKVRKVKKQKKK